MPFDAAVSYNEWKWVTSQGEKVCVWERERDREIGRGWDRKSNREKEGQEQLLKNRDGEEKNRTSLDRQSKQRYRKKF